MPPKAVLEQPTGPAPRPWTRRPATPRLSAHPTLFIDSFAAATVSVTHPTFKARPSKLRARRGSTNTSVRRRRGRTPRHGPPQSKASSSTRNLAPAVASPDSRRGRKFLLFTTEGQTPFKTRHVPPKAVLEHDQPCAAPLEEETVAAALGPRPHHLGRQLRGTDGLRQPPSSKHVLPPNDLRICLPRTTSEPAQIYD